MGRLTTHVLDTAQGKPGAGIAVELYSIGSGSERRLGNSTVTNDDGRTDAPLLEGETFKPGTWEIVFAVGDYFAKTGLPVSEPPFLDHISLRFTVSDNGHYHVPLLVSPWSYSTYRGS